MLNYSRAPLPTPHTLSHTFTTFPYNYLHPIYTIYIPLLIHTFSLRTSNPFMKSEISEEFSPSDDQMILKGKRTKRLHPSSSASSSGGDFYSTSSPTTSTTTEEDEDLANCLILLAQGESSGQNTQINSPIYAYECKTCSRTFPSFQALGGHRASHKKPKSADFHQNNSSPPLNKEEEAEVGEAKFTIAPSPSIKQLIEHIGNKPKIHECSICRAEFASGQALGGHMRRHRSVRTARIACDSSSQDEHPVVVKARNMLALDLNLPAPPEDDRCEAEFRAFSSNQQPRLVFSAVALVDCHY